MCIRATCSEPQRADRVVTYKLNQVAMETTGLVLSVIPETRAVVETIVTIIANYRSGPTTLAALVDKLRFLRQHFDELEHLLQTSKNVLPDRVKPIFKGTFDCVQECLRKSRATIESDFSRAFAGNWLISRLHRVFRYASLHHSMSSVEAEVRIASLELHHLTTIFANALKFDEKFDELVEQTREVYRPESSSPAVAQTVNLDFVSRNADGVFETPEAALKQKVLSSASSQTVTAEAGASGGTRTLHPACGVVGMAGVGKTVALQGLAVDHDIIRRFSDGVHYMRFREDADERHAIREIVKIMTITGATTSILSVDHSASLSEAVDHACKWFREKQCLFLVGDLWPTQSCNTGFLNCLRQLLRQSPASRMAISTRSHDIAHEAGSTVDFRARDPLGLVSQRIFMTHATSYSDAMQRRSEDLNPSVYKILKLCSGLPIALSVSGSAISFLMRTNLSFESSCHRYVCDFEESSESLGEEPVNNGTSLWDGIRLSLKYLHRQFFSWKSRKHVDIEHTIDVLYKSLGVSTDELWIPISVLGRMWNLDERRAFGVVNLICGMSLASISFRRDKPGLMLHDLHLKFCKRELHIQHEESLWHSKLLNGYLEDSSDVTESAGFGEVCALTTQQVVACTPRPWWTVPEDGYIHANLSRHLSCSNRGVELAAVLLDARWARKRQEVSGTQGLSTDFDVLDKLLHLHNCEEAGNICSTSIRQDFKHIAKSILLCARGLAEGANAFQFQVFGHMLGWRSNSTIVDTYMKNILASTPKPYVLPLSEISRDIRKRTGLGRRGEACAISISPDGSLVASGSKDKTVRLWSTQTGTQIETPLEGHTGTVSCVSFSHDGRQIVSGSFDKSLRLWDTETLTQIGNPFEGGAGITPEVCCCSLSFCCDGSHIVAGYIDGSIRFWNVSTREQIGATLMEHASSVVSVSESATKRFLVSRDEGGETIIWTQETKAIVWRSEETGYEMTDDEAESIIRGCGQDTPHLWPHAFPEYSGECYCRGWSLFSNKMRMKTLGRLPAEVKDWKYNADKKLFAAGLSDGAVSICRFVDDSDS